MAYASAIYEGWVTHRRHRPRPHDFRYKLAMIYVDLDELPQAMEASPFWSTRRWAPAWFRRSDYLGPRDIPLDQAVKQEVFRQKGVRPNGPVRLLTHPRYWGICFNPASFYYVFSPDGQNLEWVVAEVTNTPWREKHAYVLGPLGEPDGKGNWRPTNQKSFHVSPFLEMDMEYRWLLRAPAENLVVTIQNHDSQGQIFDASLALTRQAWNGKNLGRLLWAYPWQSLKVLWGIYWQAMKLWVKKVPFVPHPDQLKGEVR